MVGLFETVFDHQIQIVTLIEEFAIDVGMDRLESLQLLVLLGHELLVHRCDLDEHVVVRQIEVGREELVGFPFLIELDWEALRLVEPWNSIEIEEKGELTLTVVSEFNFVRRGAVGDQVAPASTAPAYSDWSGNNW